MIQIANDGLFKANLAFLRSCDAAPQEYHYKLDVNGLIRRVDNKILTRDIGLSRDDARKIIAVWATPHSDSYGFQDFGLFLHGDLHKYIEGWAHDRHVRGLDQFQSWLRALDDLANTIYLGTPHDAETLARLPV